MTDPLEDLANSRVNPDGNVPDKGKPASNQGFITRYYEVTYGRLGAAFGFITPVYITYQIMAKDSKFIALSLGVLAGIFGANVFGKIGKAIGKYKDNKQSRY